MTSRRYVDRRRLGDAEIADESIACSEKALTRRPRRIDVALFADCCPTEVSCDNHHRRRRPILFHRRKAPRSSVAGRVRPGGEKHRMNL